VRDATIGSFRGFPREAFGFYARLGQDNSRAWFDANRDVYESAVRVPLEELLGQAAAEFGSDGHVFRPNRDVRFSADKRPYKDHAGAVIGWRSGTDNASYYLQVSATGLLVASGYHELTRDQLDRYRRAVDDPRTGGALVRAVRAARAAGLEVGGQELVRAPRGYPADHPRLALLQHRRLTTSRSWSYARWMSTPAAFDRVVEVWRDGAGVARWLQRHVGAPAEPVRH
jgi:uncharacterized protein (TIGR02453 family)